LAVIFIIQYCVSDILSNKFNVLGWKFYNFSILGILGIFWWLETTRFKFLG
jgi:hypothetical protein